MVEDLKDVDMSGTSDQYVKAFIMPDKIKSTRPKFTAKHKVQCFAVNTAVHHPDRQRSSQSSAYRQKIRGQESLCQMEHPQLYHSFAKMLGSACASIKYRIFCKLFTPK
jgi:hypothetical protein